jgi:hypothetical protein
MSYQNIFNTLIQFDRFINSHYLSDQLIFFNNFRNYKIQTLLNKKEFPEMTKDDIEKFILSYEDDIFIRRILEY